VTARAGSKQKGKPVDYLNTLLNAGVGAYTAETSANNAATAAKTQQKLQAGNTTIVILGIVGAVIVGIILLAVFRKK
jgi:hypothetical protein